MRVQRISRVTRLSILVMAVALIAGVGYTVWRKKAVSNPGELDAKYVSFDGDYMFSIPPNHTANGTAVPGATIIYPEESSPQSGQALNDLYANGTVAVQPIRELKDNSPDAFSTYVKDVLAADLLKNFQGATDLRPAKQKDADANEIYALGEGGKRLRANYAINFTQPVLVVAQDRSETFQIVGFTMEDLNKSSFKADVDQAAQDTKEIAQKLRQQSSSELRKNATAKFRKQMSKAQLADVLKESSQYLQRPINIVGGLYNGKYFVAQLVFEAKVKDELPTLGIVSLQKQGKMWKLDGLQLPH